MPKDGPIMTLPSDLQADARRYASRLFGDMDTSDLPFDKVRAMIDFSFVGGWDAYVRDFHRSVAAIKGHTEVESPVKRKLRVKGFLWNHAKLRLGPFDEVIAFEQLPTVTKIVLSIAEVTEYHREDRVKSRTTRVFVFNKTDDGKWKRDEKLNISFTESVQEAHRRFGYVYTPERAADQEWQQSECYRPGTKSSPMDGAIRKLEMSHEDAFGKVQPSAEQIAERNSK